MTEKRTLYLVNPAVRQRAKAVADEVPDGWVAVFKPPLKSRPQEEKYHAMIDDIAANWHPNGVKKDPETMKRLLVDQFKADTQDDLADAWREFGRIEMEPSLDGRRVVVLGVQTRRFPKVLASAFIEWLYAFGAEVGISWAEIGLESAA